jgi:hypothetical protein
MNDNATDNPVLMLPLSEDILTAMCVEFLPLTYGDRSSEPTESIVFKDIMPCLLEALRVAVRMQRAGEKFIPEEESEWQQYYIRNGIPLRDSTLPEGKGADENNLLHQVRIVSVSLPGR